MDLGLDKSLWDSFGWSERMVLERGFSCSDKDGVFLFWDSAFSGAIFGEDLDEVQNMVNFLVEILNGEVKCGG